MLVILTIENLQIGAIALQVVERIVARNPWQDGLFEFSPTRLRKETSHDLMYHDFVSLRLVRLPENRCKLVVGITLLRSGNRWRVHAPSK
jgi:hypothetical protein